MKHCFIILFFLLSLSTIKGQKSRPLNEPNHDDRPIHFGFCLGLNMMDFVVRPHQDTSSLIADVSKPTPGFHIQVVSNYRLGEYFDLRFLPGVSFGQRNLIFYRKDNTLASDKHVLESNFLEFPLLLKYKAKRLNNFRPYLITGGNVRYDLAKTFSEDDEIFIDLKNFDYYYEAGTGVDLYLPYFKMSIEAKISYGFRNVLRHRSTNVPAYQNSIDKLNSTIWLLSFHFE